MERMCPRCDDGYLVRAAIGEPGRFSCGHEDLTVDIIDSIPPGPELEPYPAMNHETYRLFLESDGSPALFHFVAWNPAIEVLSGVYDASAKERR